MQLTPEKRRQWGRWAIGIAGFLVVWTGVAMVFPLLPSPWPPFYWALPVHGRVVDADTDQPLAGVAVVANWELRDTAWTGSPIEEIAVMESVTDEEGSFSFLWWRPRVRWPITGVLRSDAPMLLFFKNGYTREFCHNSFAPFNRNPFPSSNCNGRTITLKKFKGTTAEYAKAFWDLDRSLRFLGVGRAARRCEWKNIPHMLAALHVQQELFRKEGVHSGLSPLETLSNKSLCGSVEQFLQGYLP
ncbi:MAG: carboxypeptidase regulatory-like domain-containing protein [Deltaproteobacteria bacterium]|nr:carboxypeptidase regulatory-like domain-containing protein [Deltaproteobacteria bacterium]